MTQNRGVVADRVTDLDDDVVIKSLSNGHPETSSVMLGFGGAQIHLFARVSHQDEKHRHSSIFDSKLHKNVLTRCRTPTASPTRSRDALQRW